MGNRFGKMLWAVFGAALVFSNIALAQAPSLRGQVVDELGAVIPGAAVTLTPRDGGKARELKSGATGDFLISNIPEGAYTLSVESAGFGKYVQSDLHIPQTSPLKITLAVAAVTAITDVAAESKTVPVYPGRNRA